MIQLTENQLENIIKDASELGALHALAKIGKIKLYLNKSQAYRFYGKKNVQDWIAQSLIVPIKDGQMSSCWRISRLDLDLVSKNVAREIYL